MMKTWFIVPGTVLFSLCLKAQVNYPIPQEPTSEWRIDYAQWDGTSNFVRTNAARVFVAGDTLINGNTYSRLLSTGVITTSWLGGSYDYPYENAFYGFIRTDSARTWVFYDTTEELLYDFSLQAGDTLPMTTMNWSPTVIVSSVDSVLVNGKYLRRFNLFDPVQSDLICHWYIEGIGSENGLISPMQLMMDNGWTFGCYAEDHAPVFPEDTDCILSVNAIYVDTPAGRPEIFPNPAEDFLTVRIYSPEDCEIRLRILDISGRQFSAPTQHLVSGMNEFSVNVSYLVRGIYLLTTNPENEILNVKFMKK
ncbi:MAG: T9SS type A sorting domain-containing protein [Bacteroidales bacterium]|jgi:hypothetical protein|nr:T9SS type A sorting domain-containing protein [Bacteroidales bacterium]